MRFHLMHANAGPTNRIRAATIEQVIAKKPDVALFNEVQNHAKALDRAGYGKVQPHPARANAIIFKRSRFEWVHTHYKRIMVGGKPGGRRRGPDRWAVAAVLRDKQTGEMWVFISTHLIAKAYTTRPWRRPLWNSSAKSLSAFIRKLADTYPKARIFNAGDFNRSGGNWNFSQWVRTWPAYVTYGRRQRYDRIFTARGVTMTNYTTVKTASDHKALTARVSIKEEQ